MNVFGNWWPGTKGKEANKEYEVQVMAVDEQFIPSDSGPGTKGSIHFQVALVDKSDPHSTRATTQLVEKHNYWWVTNSAFSAAHFAHKARTDQAAEKTSLDAMQSAAAAPKTAAVVPATEGQKAKTAFESLWTREAGVKDGKKGNFFRCYDISCPKNEDPYFVATSNNPPFIRFFFNSFPSSTQRLSVI
jgi:hypothetical protein